MRTMGCTILWIGLAAVVLQSGAEAADNADAPAKPTLSAAQTTAISEVDLLEKELVSVNRSIWDYAEVSLQEEKSSQLLIEKLKKYGFEVETGLAGMPTAFKASFGSGRPIVGVLAEYDALPGMSQKAISFRSPVNPGEPGHACGHSGLGTGALGAALAVKASIEKHQLPGTIRLYGTPGEEIGVGKVYMLLSGQFRDLDVCLHWHPGTGNQAWSGSSKSLISVRFAFTGTSAHASAAPEKGRSALDAVELMNMGVNFMREHIKEDARLHYVITDGGDAPNVVPATASVWYYVRANRHQDAEYYFRWLNEVAQGAAMMTRTQVAVHIETDCHEIVPNDYLAELIHNQMQLVGPPRFDDREKLFAHRLQQPLMEEFGVTYGMPLDESILPLSARASTSKGSTDVGDISWHVPTCGMRATCFVYESPGHSWQNVATIGSTIGEKGTLFAAKVLAVTALDLVENASHVQAARSEWEQRMRHRSYTTLIPEGQPVPGLK